MSRSFRTQALTNLYGGSNLEPEKDLKKKCVEDLWHWNLTLNLRFIYGNEATLMSENIFQVPRWWDNISMKTHVSVQNFMSVILTTKVLVTWKITSEWRARNSEVKFPDWFLCIRMNLKLDGLFLFQWVRFFFLRTGLPKRDSGLQILSQDPIFKVWIKDGGLMINL